MQLTRESIVAAAITILDDYGLADMTMRRLAKHLEVVPGALYWHIPNKQSLIEAIADEILAPVWKCIAVDKPSAAELCCELRRAMVAHRDGAEVVGAALPVGDMTARINAALIDALSRSLLNKNIIAVTASTLINFTVGATLQEQSRRQLNTALDRENTPQSEDAERFALGVDLILAGAHSNRSVE